MAPKPKPDQKLVVETLWLAGATDDEGGVDRQAIQANLDGLEGDRHYGFVKPADARDVGIKRGTPVRNWRQWSAVSVEELKVIAEKLSVSHVKPEWLMANICFSGMEELSKISGGAKILFPSGAILHVECENAPCIGPGKQIQKHFQQLSPSQFPKLAAGLRGIVGVVYCAGVINVGDVATLRYE